VSSHGPWWRVYALFACWQVLGVWERIESALIGAADAQGKLSWQARETEVSEVLLYRGNRLAAVVESNGWAGSAPAVPAEPGGHEPPSSTSTDGRASSASVLSAFWHEYELSCRRRALEQLVRSAHFGEWQALGHDRVDLATTKQLE
jgi:hypothetical protein